MRALTKGRYCARAADNEFDIVRSQRLRHHAFLNGDGSIADVDAFDSHCTHILVEDTATGALVSSFRLMIISCGDEIDKSYSAQYYDLRAMQALGGPLLEVGRVCIKPGQNDPDILRLALGAITIFVDENKIKMLFGCSSFAGINGNAYIDTFSMLRDYYLAPKRWLPEVKASNVFSFAAPLKRKPNPQLGKQHMPPLLRTYLLMGGRVSDHAVVDEEMNTMHVFTGLEVCAIPTVRKQLLRAIRV